MRLFVYLTISASVAGITPSQLSARETSYFAVATSSFGELYLSRERCPVSWMTGRARLVHRIGGGVSEMCWRTDKKIPRLLNVCNVSPKLTKKGEVGACMPASKSMFVRLDSLPQRAF